MTQRARARDIGTIVCAVILGVVLGLGLARVQAFEFENKLTLGDCLAAAIAVAVATILYSAVGQLSDRRKFLIGLVTEELRFVLERVDEIDRFFEDSTIQPKSLLECQRTIYQLRQAVNRMHLVRKQLDLLRLGKQTIDVCAEVQTALGSFRHDMPDQFSC